MTTTLDTTVAPNCSFASFNDNASQNTQNSKQYNDMPLKIKRVHIPISLCDMTNFVHISSVQGQYQREVDKSLVVIFVVITYIWPHIQASKHTSSICIPYIFQGHYVLQNGMTLVIPSL